MLGANQLKFIKVPKVFKPTNKITYLQKFGYQFDLMSNVHFLPGPEPFTK